MGDIANHDHPLLGMRVRVEHWAAALNQPKAAAAAMLGEDVQYSDLPYFYTDQYDLGMEYVGHAPRGSFERVVVRGDLAAREFVAFWLDGGDRIKAAMNVNVWDVVDEIKPLIRAGVAVDPERLADPAVKLRRPGLGLAIGPRPSAPWSDGGRPGPRRRRRSTSTSVRPGLRPPGFSRISPRGSPEFRGWRGSPWPRWSAVAVVANVSGSIIGTNRAVPPAASSPACHRHRHDPRPTRERPPSPASRHWRRCTASSSTSGPMPASATARSSQWQAHRSERWRQRSSTRYPGFTVRDYGRTLDEYTEMCILQARARDAAGTVLVVTIVAPPQHPRRLAYEQVTLAGRDEGRSG